MTRLWPTGVSIHVGIDRRGRLLHFSWQSRVYQVQQTQQRWQVDTEWWGERVWRDYFAVTTTDGLLCVLYHNLPDGTWYLSKLYD